MIDVLRFPYQKAILRVSDDRDDDDDDDDDDLYIIGAVCLSVGLSQK